MSDSHTGELNVRFHLDSEGEPVIESVGSKMPFELEYGIPVPRDLVSEAIKTLMMVASSGIEGAAGEVTSHD